MAVSGLTEGEARARQQRGDVNLAPPPAGRTYRQILTQNAFTPVNSILYVIVALLLALGLAADALLTAGLALVNVVVSVVQEWRAKHQLDRIALLARPTATVIRDGSERAVPPEQIVLGDLLVVRAGDQICVDGAVTESAGMYIDEALLTGESDLIAKRVGDRVYSGSFCVAGAGRYEAQAVGAGIVAARVTARARGERNPLTPLQREIGVILRVVAVIVLALAVQSASAYWQLYHTLSWVEIARAAAVLVALVPQGIVFMVTVTYAMAAVRMAGKGALVQRMNAVESASHIDVLCLDKTGTLTTNDLVLEELLPLSGDPARVRGWLGAFAASTASANHTTAAIRETCGGAPREVRAEAPFSSARKWSGVAFAGPEAATLILGAPEVMAAALADRGDLDRQVGERAARGLRVLLFAAAPAGAELFDAAGEPALPPDLLPLALLTLRDQLRPEASETLAAFAASGITIKIISGDNPETVSALARQAGLGGDVRAVSGAELEGLSPAQLAALVEQTTIFGRITPEQKEQLVQALRRQGHYVAMTGDGVNDVPALKQADLAVAMRGGSAVTRAVADIVLLEDSFAPLPAAFREGQRIRRGMDDIIRLFLVRTSTVALLILAASLLREPFPISPRHNGLVALITVGIPTLALAAWARPGSAPHGLVSSAWRFVAPAALSTAGVAMIVYLFFLATTDDADMARSAMSITAVLCGLILIPFLQPPNAAWAAAREVNGDLRPALLAGGLLLVFLGALLLPGVRHFGEIEGLPAASYPLLALVVTGWATALRLLWRLHLSERVHAFLTWGQPGVSLEEGRSAPPIAPPEGGAGGDQPAAVRAAPVSAETTRQR